jgi:hypothetical protein
MIRALLAGQKTQTRRLLTSAPKGDWHCDRVGNRLMWVALPGVPKLPCIVPYAAGDRLYVREAWRTGLAYQDLAPSDMGGEEPVLFEADGTTERWTPGSSEPGRLRRGMHMPRWASRLWLAVTDVRVQRLQQCSETDAEAEGCVWDSADGYDVWYVPGAKAARNGATAVECYSILWDSLHAEPTEQWAANPWVVAVTFAVHQGNIDSHS